MSIFNKNENKVSKNEVEKLQEGLSIIDQREATLKAEKKKFLEDASQIEAEDFEKQLEGAANIDSLLKNLAVLRKEHISKLEDAEEAAYNEKAEAFCQTVADSYKTKSAVALKALNELIQSVQSMEASFSADCKFVRFHPHSQGAVSSTISDIQSAITLLDADTVAMVETLKHRTMPHKRRNASYENWKAANSAMLALQQAALNKKGKAAID